MELSSKQGKNQLRKEEKTDKQNCFISLLYLHIEDDQVRAFLEELATYLEGHLAQLDAVCKTNL